MSFYICKFRTVRDFLDWAENEKDLSLPCMLFYAKDQMLDAYESNDLVMVAFADKDMLQDFIDKMEDNSAKVININKKKAFSKNTMEPIRKDHV